MTELEWLTSTDINKMLDLLQRAQVVTAPDLPDYVVSTRKLRLWTCSLARLVFDIIGKKNQDYMKRLEKNPEANLSPVDGTDWEACITHGWWECFLGVVKINNKKIEAADLLRHIVGNPFRKNK